MPVADKVLATSSEILLSTGITFLYFANTGNQKRATLSSDDIPDVNEDVQYDDFEIAPHRLARIISNSETIHNEKTPPQTYANFNANDNFNLGSLSFRRELNESIPESLKAASEIAPRNLIVVKPVGIEEDQRIEPLQESSKTFLRALDELLTKKEETGRKELDKPTTVSFEESSTGIALRSENDANDSGRRDLSKPMTESLDQPPELALRSMSGNEGSGRELKTIKDPLEQLGEIYLRSLNDEIQESGRRELDKPMSEPFNQLSEMVLRSLKGGRRESDEPMNLPLEQPDSNGRRELIAEQEELLDENLEIDQRSFKDGKRESVYNSVTLKKLLPNEPNQALTITNATFDETPAKAAAAKVDDKRESVKNSVTLKQLLPNELNQSMIVTNVVTLAATPAQGDQIPNPRILSDDIIESGSSEVAIDQGMDSSNLNSRRGIDLATRADEGGEIANPRILSDESIDSAISELDTNQDMDSFNISSHRGTPPPVEVGKDDDIANPRILSDDNIDTAISEIANENIAVRSLTEQNIDNKNEANEYARDEESRRSMKTNHSLVKPSGFTSLLKVSVPVNNYVPVNNSTQESRKVFDANTTLMEKGTVEREKCIIGAVSVPETV